MLVKGIIFHAAMTGGPYQNISPESASKPLKEQLRTDTFGWPPNSKPRTLFHVYGETLLERTVAFFREYGVNDIRIVVGYKKELIEQYNEEKKLGLEIVYNPDWVDDYSYLRTGQPGQDYLKGMKTVQAGLQGMDDDLLMTYGDVLMMRCVVKVAIEAKLPLAMVISHLFKISRSHLYLLNDLPNYGGGTGVHLPLRHLFLAHVDVAGSEAPRSNNPICYMLNDDAGNRGFGVGDVDYYSITDEYKKVQALKLRSEGWSYEQIAKELKLDQYDSWYFGKTGWLNAAFTHNLKRPDPAEWIQRLCNEADYPLRSMWTLPECENCKVDPANTKTCEFRWKVYNILCPKENQLHDHA